MLIGLLRVLLIPTTLPLSSQINNPLFTSLLFSIFSRNFTSLLFTSPLPLSSSWPCSNLQKRKSFIESVVPIQWLLHHPTPCKLPMKLRIPKFKGTTYSVTQSGTQDSAKALARFLARGKTAVLTGAGISTASGLPDYRGPQGTYTTNPDHRPTLYHEFVDVEHLRKRYWTRAWVGYEQALSQARPNGAHFALQKLHDRGLLTGLVTQNVDGLHVQAGSGALPVFVELHGSAYRVHCLGCGSETLRSTFQDRMLADNCGLREVKAAIGRRHEAKTAAMEKISAGGSADSGETMLNADGDAEFDAEQAQFDYDNVSIPACSDCGGLLKPSIVFFGENVPLSVREKARDLLASSEQLLVVGTSLSTFSAFDLVRSFYRSGRPIAVLNKGALRGEGKDFEATVRLDGDIRDILECVAAFP